MPRKKRQKRQWTEPIILVPIIVAVITAIVSPIIVPIIQDMLKKPSPPQTEEPTSTPTPGSPAEANIMVATDKQTYSIGEIIEIRKHQ